jgi:hypothetical protein
MPYIPLFDVLYMDDLFKELKTSRHSRMLLNMDTTEKIFYFRLSNNNIQEIKN